MRKNAVEFRQRSRLWKRNSWTSEIKSKPSLWTLITQGDNLVNSQKYIVLCPPNKISGSKTQPFKSQTTPCIYTFVLRPAKVGGDVGESLLQLVGLFMSLNGGDGESIGTGITSPTVVRGYEWGRVSEPQSHGETGPYGKQKVMVRGRCDW